MADKFLPSESRSGEASSVSRANFQLSVKCTKLVGNTFSKSNPMCVMFQALNGKWYEVGRTEQLKNTFNPMWVQKLQMLCNFETKQVIKFEIYDSYLSQKKLKKRELGLKSWAEKLGRTHFLGRVETTMIDVVSAPCRQFVSKLKGVPKNEGSQIFIDVEEVYECNDLVQLQFSAHKLYKKDTFGKSDPFYVISKGMPSGQFIIVHRSEVIKNKLSPTWKTLHILMKDLCSNDCEKPLKIDVYDEEMDREHNLIGSFTTDLNTLKLSASKNIQYPLLNPKKEARKKDRYIDSGKMNIMCCKIIQKDSFPE